MAKCEKHGCIYEIRQEANGKTRPVCPECEKEYIRKINNMLWVLPETTFTPFIAPPKPPKGE